jgi:hypothetical protein
MKVGTIKKQPSEVRTLSIKYDDALDTDDEIGIVTSCVVDPDGELTVSPTLATTRRVRLWISGGVDGGTYKVTVVVNTVGGETHEDEVIVKVAEI